MPSRGVLPISCESSSPDFLFWILLLLAAAGQRPSAMFPRHFISSAVCGCEELIGRRCSRPSGAAGTPRPRKGSIARALSRCRCQAHPADRRSRADEMCRNPLAQFALATHTGGPVGASPATEVSTERGVGSFGKMARWYQARSLLRYLVATPRRPRRKVWSRSWRLLAVSRWRSARRRSPASWSSGWSVTPKARAQGGKNGAPSVTRSASGSIVASRLALMPPLSGKLSPPLKPL